MTEPLTPRELRQSIADKLATVPAGVDAQGHSQLDRQIDSDRFDRFAEAVTPMVPEPPVQEPMHANRMQGHSASGANIPATPNTTLGRIRAQAAKHTTI